MTCQYCNRKSHPLNPVLKTARFTLCTDCIEALSDRLPIEALAEFAKIMQRIPLNKNRPWERK